MRRFSKLFHEHIFILHAVNGYDFCSYSLFELLVHYVTCTLKKIALIFTKCFMFHVSWCVLLCLAAFTTFENIIFTFHEVISRESDKATV